MNLNPVVVIPTYWSGRRSVGSMNRGVQYDHMTPIDKEGELPRCLDSLRQVVGLGRVVLLVVSEPGIENQAVEKVRSIVARYSDLDIVVIGEPELRHIHRQMEQLGIGAFASSACLTGYGAIRNLGILVASIFGHDTIVFLDDDEIVLNPDFLEKAVYGIACKTPNGALITGKTGYFLDAQGDYRASDDVAWYDRFWDKAHAFNDYMDSAVKGPRLSSANVACGGCLVLHADMYGSVAFDPWINRGEDLDYVLSVHMYGMDLWFDNQLNLQHLAPESTSPVLRFEQNMARWFYELRKVEFGKTQIDLLQINPRSFDPYPGPWITHRISSRALWTALFRLIGCPEHGEYWRVATKGRKQAIAFARENCAKYFEFQHQWPGIVRSLWNCTPLATQLSGARSASVSPAFTGRFSAVKVADADPQDGATS